MVLGWSEFPMREDPNLISILKYISGAEEHL